MELLKPTWARNSEAMETPSLHGKGRYLYHFAQHGWWLCSNFLCQGFLVYENLRLN